MATLEVDVAIIGGGMAAYWVERFLPKEWSRAVFCGKEKRASEIPMGILHPFPGRSFSVSQEQLEAFQYAKLYGVAPRKLFRITNDNERLYRSFKSVHEWGEISVEERKEGDELSLVCFPSFAVRGENFCMTHNEENLDAVFREGAHWRLEPVGMTARHVVLCIGASLSEWFPQVGLRTEYGEVFFANAPSLDRIVAQNGIYAADYDEHLRIIGASRYSEETARTKEQQKMKVAAERMLGPQDWTERRWQGARLVAPDRMPVAGSVPGLNNFWVSGAYSGKGLLWSPYGAKRIVHGMVNGVESMESSLLAPARFPSWTSSRVG